MIPDVLRMMEVIKSMPSQNRAVLALICTAIFSFFIFISHVQLASARPLAVLAPTTIDDAPSTAPFPNYSGAGWSLNTVVDTIFNTLHWTNVEYSSVTLAWSDPDGGTITPIFSMAANRGPVDLYIDGSLKYQYNTYSPYTQRGIFTSFRYGANGTGHSITLVNRGTSGAFMDIDAFAINVAAVGPGVYDSTNPQFRSYGQFQTPQASSGAYGGSVNWSNVLNNYWRFTFTGDNITLVYSKANTRGSAQVVVSDQTLSSGIKSPSKRIVDQYVSGGTVYRLETESWVNTSHDYGLTPLSINMTVPGIAGGGGGTLVDVDALVIGTQSVYITSGLDLSFNGCEQGRQMVPPSNGIVVLDFGQPWVSGGVYGTKIWVTGGGTTYASPTTIKNMAQSWIQSFANCSPTGATVTLVIGTNTTGSSYITNAGGQAWNQMVQQIVQWTSTNGYASKVQVVAGNDMENGPIAEGWAPLNQVLQWASGFHSYNVSVGGTPARYYNYGACVGCPLVTSGAFATGDRGWALIDFYNLSWGNGEGLPLPEIYNTTGANAKQWQVVANSVLSLGRSLMMFQGVMTQKEACTAPPPPSGCAGVDNTPGGGWMQLWRELTGSTAQNLPTKVNDITWQPW